MAILNAGYFMCIMGIYFIQRMNQRTNFSLYFLHG